MQKILKRQKVTLMIRSIKIEKFLFSSFSQSGCYYDNSWVVHWLGPRQPPRTIYRRKKKKAREYEVWKIKNGSGLWSSILVIVIISSLLWSDQSKSLIPFKGLTIVATCNETYPS